MKKSTVIIIVIFVILLTMAVGCVVGYLLVKNINNSQEESQSETGEPTSVTEEKSVSEDDQKRLIFIHHSTGENWLADEDGGLGEALMEADYYVSDTNYGWGPSTSSGQVLIGDLTDIGHWWLWFRGENSDEIMKALYVENGQNSSYTRFEDDYTGENEIIMFKSCFPNSALSGSENDTVPDIEDNPLKGEACDSEYHTISNAKGIYIDILKYFETKQDKLFIVVTAPPLGENNSSDQQAENARAFNNWLVNDWLSDYLYENVKVFDFYDVLTNYGESNYSQFTTDESDDHPNQEGNQMATHDFIPFLDEAYDEWQGSGL